MKRCHDSPTFITPPEFVLLADRVKEARRVPVVQIQACGKVLNKSTMILSTIELTALIYS